MKRTVWGFEIRAVGENAAAARFAGMPGHRDRAARRPPLGRARRARRRAARSRGCKGYLTLDLSPGFGYAGIVVAMLAPVAARRRRRRDLRRRRVRRGRYDEPHHRRAELHRRPRRRDVAALRAGRGDHAVRAGHAVRVPAGRHERTLDILVTASFWAAAIRIATPLIFGVPGRAALRARRRAQPRHRGHLRRGRDGGLAGRLSRLPICGRRAGRGADRRGASACCTPSSPCRSGCRSTSPASASRCWRPASPTIGYRVALPQVTSAAAHRALPPAEPARLSRHSVPRRRAAQQTALTWLAFALRRRARLRALPHAARPRRPRRSATIRRRWRRRASIVTACASARSWRAAALMAVGGAFLTMSAFNAFFFGMVNGRGWICIALTVFALVAAGQGAARRAAVRRLRRLPAAAADRCRRRRAQPDLPDAALCLLHRGAGRWWRGAPLSAGADAALPQASAEQPSFRLRSHRPQRHPAGRPHRHRHRVPAAARSSRSSRHLRRRPARRSTRRASSSRRPSSIAISTWTRRCRSACRASTSRARCSRASRCGAS